MGRSMASRTAPGALRSGWIARAHAFGAALALVASSGVAIAQSGDVATAEVLFRQGKQMLDAKDYAQACPRLAESYRLDPATGALFALAACHEGQGKLASAWNEYSEALTRAQKDGRADRISAAKERIQAIEPRLSSLAIKVSDSVVALPGFELKRDGVALGKVVVGVPVPVDGADHTVEVSAAGKKPWKATVAVEREKDKKVVSVSSLDEAAPASATAAPPAPAAVAPTKAAADMTPTAGSGGLSSTQIAGFVVGGAGVAGLAVGSIFGLGAIGKNNDAKAGCTGAVCRTPEALQSRNDARSAAAVSTVAFVAGGALAAAGVTLYFVGGPKRDEKTGVSIVPAVGAGQWDLSLQGAF
jgi:hypothetical protein